MPPGVGAAGWPDAAAHRRPEPAPRQAGAALGLGLDRELIRQKVGVHLQ